MLDRAGKMLIAPKSKDKDRARREFILNILLIALIVLSATAFFTNVIQLFFYERKVAETPLVLGAILGFFVILYILSRKGKSYLSAISLVSLLLLISVYINVEWGADLPVSLLFAALMIVIAGVLIGTKFAFVITFLSVSSVMLFSYLEVWSMIHPNRVREIEGLRIADSVVHVIILAIIATVSWLFNREIEKALKRARSSEKALKRQRDQLEVLIEERTQELQQVQAEKLIQLYRFAELGRLSSGLFHDLASPLNLISLNLDRLQSRSEHIHAKEEITTVVERAQLGAQQIESFISAARKQIQNQEILQTFSLKNEIMQAIQILDYKAKALHVQIVFAPTRDIRGFGNPIKFYQLIMNLVSNSIEAYEGIETKSKKAVTIELKRIKQTAIVTIHDWGSGIKPKDLPKVFDPLFTTKGFEKGTGIGLSLCKETVERYFLGTIEVVSNKKNGTIFTVTFPIQKAPQGKIVRETFLT